jgi:hypothetical protein
VSESHINTAVCGSYFLADYELRIAARCLEEDFGVSPATPMGDLLDHPIVKALIKDRATDPDAGKIEPRRWCGFAPTTAGTARAQPTIRSGSTSPS